MHIVTGVSRVFVWVSLVISTLFQGLAMFGIARNSEFSIIPMLVATFVMVAAAILYFALPKGKLFPLLMAVGAAVLFIIVAILLAKEFPVRLGIDGSDQGLTPWRLVYRHLSPLLVPLFLTPLYIEYRAECKAAAARAHEEAPDSYFNLLDKDFKLSRLEDESTIPPPKHTLSERLRKHK